ncbi:MAG: PD-(D/E)XK nuclease family protein [Thermoanaerobaculia bacterium]
MQQAEIQWGPPARAITAAGPRLCEALLLQKLDEFFDERGAEVLARPIRLVVPSKSLRWHVLERVLAHRGRAVAGVDCRTHHGLAVTVTEQAGKRAAISTDLFPLFARRLAHEETPLRRTLDHLRDGYTSILASVSDLLDAGLDPAHVEALEEVLESEGSAVATPFEVERAKSLVRVASRTSSVLATQGLGRSSHLLQAATGLIKQNPELLPSSAVFVYGYNDATGLTADFLLALVQTFGGAFFLDDPPDPIDPTVADSGVAFARAYRERVAVALGSERDPSRPSRPGLEAFRAVGSDAEVREAARRIRSLVDAGNRPERIGVVTRRLGAYHRAVRTHFDRLGIPFSGVAREGPPHPSSFRVGAVVELLKQRDQVPLERWLDARSLAPGLRNDLELGFHALGIARLSEAAVLDVKRFIRTARGGSKGSDLGLPLPVRTGFDAGAGEPRAAHRYLATSHIEEAVASARALSGALSKWSRLDTLGGHLDALRSLLSEHLDWQASSRIHSDLLAEIDKWSGGIPDDVELDFHEFATLLSFRLENFGSTELGGSGGGVQVLEVVEARSRTFEHLFVLGLNRGVFPRVIQEDPLLPDRLREVISRHGFGVLPDLQRKLPGFDEERYLFAQLLSSSPRITLSWLEVDDEHALRTPSPLIERLRWSSNAPDQDLRQPATAHPVLSRSPDGSGLQPALECAIVAGTEGTREQFAELLDIAEREARARFDSAGDEDLTRIRLRILDEADPVRGTDAGEAIHGRLGPFFGFVGPAVTSSDPRNRERLFVTTLEQVARCPWRTFVERVLRVETLPDPLEVLPGVNPLLIGNLVHRVLEEIVDDGLDVSVEDLEQARSAAGSTVRWPGPEELEGILLRNARTVAFEQGITLAGFDRVLASVCGRHLEIANELDWIDQVSRFSILASELYGDIEWSEPPATIAFKADRVDRNADRLIFTDYKTGKGLRAGRYRTSDRKLLLEGLRSGEWLQAAIYALAGGGSEDAGRYLFVGPTFEEGQNREIVLRASDEEARSLLERALRATLGAWRDGAFFPRLVQHDQNVEPPLCRFCDVAEACLRGDSGARGRLRSWTEQRRVGGNAREESGAEAVLRAWYLRDRSAYMPSGGEGP